MPKRKRSQMLDTKQTFIVEFYANGEHKDAKSERKVHTTLPQLPALIESWRLPPDTCCWVAYDEEDYEVAQQLCQKVGA